MIKHHEILYQTINISYFTERPHTTNTHDSGSLNTSSINSFANDQLLDSDQLDYNEGDEESFHTANHNLLILSGRAGNHKS